jgi:hypothetical protein
MKMLLGDDLTQDELCEANEEIRETREAGLPTA